MNTDDARCCLCEKTRQEVRRLWIAGRTGNAVCNECVGEAVASEPGMFVPRVVVTPTKYVSMTLGGRT